ncbi:signal peptide peptidase SppA [Propylenella binzhouense]|uniref:Signal peptide peptidase SppA n=1 Tax=Propylenella binzhouense TaxID=2555902 RepID=A0A964WUZ4_9HYPH|nr:signal peptide peptidase SppA [Propylenella binzhouense]MYZ49340.1 signal peptide peptidase SppA [Propylenella binzhouense]
MDADTILERRRLRRRATFWRVTAFLILAAAVFLLFARQPGIGPFAGSPRGEVARIDVDGFIGTRPDAVELIEDAAKSRRVKAILIRIDSPGGAAAGGEALYRALRAAAAKKPIVAVIDGIGTSAAYMTAIATDHIVAAESAITGSIGVIFQYAHFEELIGKLGAQYEEVKSAPLKGQPSPFTATSPEARAMLQQVVTSTYEWFVGLVADRRGFSTEEAHRLSDGSIFTGRQALGAKLVDAIGGESEARAWLASAKGVPADIPAVEWKKDEFGLPFFASRESGAIAWIARISGLDQILTPAAESFLPPRLMVDGLLSVWQAPGPIPNHR